MSIVKRLISALSWVILAAMLSAVSFVMLTARYGWQYDAILSGSMEPLLAVGGLVVLKPVDPQVLQYGDVIAFKLPDVKTPICHRIIDIRETPAGRYFQTMGDANEDPDQGLVPAGDVLGRKVFYLPYLGNITRISELGRNRVSVVGKSVPTAALVTVVLGLAFIGLTLKDSFQDITSPWVRRTKELTMKRREALLKRKKALFG